MKNRKRGYLLGAIALLGGPPAFACNCAPVKSAEIEYAAHDAVFRAMRISSSEELMPGYPRRLYAKETVRFRVTRVWKGSLKVGDEITTVSEIGAGPCGKSATNDPLWIETIGGPPLRFKGDWLIYASGAHPWSLSMCTRSTPMELKNAKRDIAVFDRIANPRYRIIDNTKKRVASP